MILSGAGLSAESDISTFRDSDGLWERYDVMEVCSTQGWQQNRKLVTDFYNARRRELAKKEPNAAHFALAELERKYPGRVWNLTQNVDDMLERAGCKEVIHLHGTLRDLRCESCHRLFDIGYRAQKEEERCPYCGSADVRHNVVMFGESAPEYRHIYEAVDDCGLFVAIGTSGRVIDIASLAGEFYHSILVNPKREEHITAYGNFDKMIDAYFEHFLQERATAAAAEMTAMIEEYLDEE
ncbi:Sir2 family NAD-dependent protein deacetylase [Sulfurimonas sp. HSL3-7]|uniref:SIR2 family NAD-dependent protein deacylase n=1 Tax=Sulfonitrofixus jiaomeiensis TaxID=3131938 RepID=UPI0031F7D00D